MQNRPCPNESNARNNLRRYAGGIGRHSCKTTGKDREHRRPETNKHVGPQPGWAVPQFALQSNGSSENGCQHQAYQRGCNKTTSHLSVQQVENIVPDHLRDEMFQLEVRWPDFIIGLDSLRSAPG